MKYINLTLGTLFSILLIVSCGPAKKSSESDKPSEESTVAETVEKYKVYKAPASQAYPEATLALEAPAESTLDTGDVTFNFSVTNYELGVQTSDAAERGIANSGKGQHIHFIWDNGPYSAHYEPEFSKNLEEGQHVLLAFLSRSYHESVKNQNAFVVQDFTVGSPTEAQPFDKNGQHMFYSRPKGTYSGKDTEKLMLDFFLYNTSISEDGNKVRATINGEEHMLTDWAPYYIEGLEKGELTIKLEFIDKDGNLIPGPFNSVERKVTLK